MTVDAIGPTLAETGVPAPALPGGGTLGKYRLDRVIGAGGMGMVWAGYDPDLERSVAIKVLLDAGEAALRTRLLREARAMARLKHPNVLVVYEVGTDANRDYIAMELVDGGDLAAWLRAKPLRADVVTALVAAGQGLAAAHDAGLIHRDFKPHNILRSLAGRVYVTDFGLARGQLDLAADVALVPATHVGDSPSAGPRAYPLDSVLDSELTQTGVLIGTPAYMAPEQFAGLVPDPRTDQFAFCVTAWEALAGARPFTGDTLDALKAAVGRGASKAPGELSSAVRAVLTRGLSAEPASRWSDMHALLAAFEHAVAPPRPRWPVLLAAVTVLAIGVTAVVLSNRGGDAPSPPTPPPTPVLQPGACVPAEEAFRDAWSPERRSKIIKLRRAPLAGAIAILDELAHQWTDAYGEACREAPTAQAHTRIACLLGVRDEVVSETEDLADEDERVDTAALGLLVASVHQCLE